MFLPPIRSCNVPFFEKPVKSNLEESYLEERVWKLGKHIGIGRIISVISLNSLAEVHFQPPGQYLYTNHRSLFSSSTLMFFNAESANEAKNVKDF